MFVSYAQNYEDVMLWRALKHVKEGFYIDIGAAWPEIGSVTKAFYDRNWHGINIEPNVDMWRLLAAERPRDINLRLALSDRRGSGDFYILEDAGLSTLMPDIVALHEAKGLQAKREQIEVSTLADVWRQNVGSRDVHFLKIDVEGAEHQVLLGNDWSSCRPWIIIVEATVPMTQIASYEIWEPTILSAHYQLAYDDGLNRFYVATERQDISLAFSSPPNVFDDFVPVAQFNAEASAHAAEVRAQAAEVRAHAAEVRVKAAEDRAQAAESAARETRTRLQTLVTRVRRAQARAQKAKARIAKIKSTLSWKLTKPIRIVGRAISRRFGRSR